MIVVEGSFEKCFELLANLYVFGEPAHQGRKVRKSFFLADRNAMTRINLEAQDQLSRKSNRQALREQGFGRVTYLFAVLTQVCPHRRHVG